jgi:hypothetical protein
MMILIVFIGLFVEVKLGFELISNRLKSRSLFDEILDLLFELRNFIG